MGLIPLAIAGSVIIGVVLIIFANRKHIETPYIVVINAENDKFPCSTRAGFLTTTA